MIRYAIVLASFCLMLATANADESAITNGKTLYEKHCVTCHGPEIYTRPDRRVTSKQKLIAQVQVCEQNLKLKWFDDEIESVAEYLNKKFYHFQ